MTHLDEEITNAERAERFQTTLESYHDEHDVPANLIDILTDARHWCDLHNWSFAEFDRIAYQHYLEERSSDKRRPK